MKCSRLFKIAKRACLHKLRGDHAALLEDQPLLALHLLQGHADFAPSCSGEFLCVETAHRN